MEITNENIDTIYDFKGLWDLPSRCGLKIVRKNHQTVVVVTELYRDNPGTSVTNVAASLAIQICKDFSLLPEKMVYIECNPEMKSKLSFYSEKNYLVEFVFDGSSFGNPQYKLLNKEELNGYLSK